MSTVGIYAGSFDPVTRGHLSVIDQASLAFDQVIVAVGINPSKHETFSHDERQHLIRGAVEGLPNVRVVSFQGLLAEYCTSVRTDTKKVVIVRGLRAVTDFEAEMAIAYMNRQLASEIPTVFMPTDEHYAYISSSAAREMARHATTPEAARALLKLVPRNVAEALFAKIHPNRGPLFKASNSESPPDAE